MINKLGAMLAVGLLAMTVAGCQSTASSSSGGGTTSVNPCAAITPLPTVTPAPEPGPDQMGCLIGSIAHTIGVDSDENRTHELSYKRWHDECLPALATWKAWTAGHNQLWMDDRQLKLSGDCGPAPKR